MRIILSALAAAWLLSACAALPLPRSQGNAKLIASSAMPSVEGTVQFGQTDDGNTSIALRARHLARPDRLTPSAQTYVVWLQPSKEEPAQNIGALAVDEDLNGALQAVTPFKQFELFVTGEQAPDARRPSGEPLLWTTYSR